MPTYSVAKTYTWAGEPSDKARLVMRLFGLTLERLCKRKEEHRCTIDIQPGDVVYLTGPSGSGKTTLLKELERQIPPSERINLDEIGLPRDRLVVDCLEADFLKTLRILSAAGLSDAFSVLSPPVNLSDGEKWRFRLAMALNSGKRFIFADEFCSNLDRICALVIAHKVRQFAKRNGVTFILASSHRDTLMELGPDVLVVKDRSGPAEVIYKYNQRPWQTKAAHAKSPRAT